MTPTSKETQGESNFCVFVCVRARTSVCKLTNTTLRKNIQDDHTWKIMCFTIPRTRESTMASKHYTHDLFPRNAVQQKLLKEAFQKHWPQICYVHRVMEGHDT